MKYLGVDWGEVRIGLALGDNETKIATPFKTVKNADDVRRAATDEKINVIVLGRPVSITNHQSPITNEKYHKFVQALKAKIGVPVAFIDERLSSKAADALPGNKKTKAGRDEIAAMLILQSYLDRQGRA